MLVGMLWSLWRQVVQHVVQDKALILNDHFLSVGRPDDGLCPNLTDFTPCQSIMSDVKFDAVNVLKQINKLKINSSPGPDNIPSVLLKM